MGPDTATISGTSMATPHVAGAAALYLSANGGASPEDVANALVGDASLNKISLHRKSRRNGTPNRLLYVGPPDGGEPPANVAPTASFDFTCTLLACAFTDNSSDDSDGTVEAWSWTFGSEGTSSLSNPEHEFGAEGTYPVTLTVTDDDGATGFESRNVTVSSESSGDFTLTANGFKVRGRHQVDLTWSGTSVSPVDVYRDGTPLLDEPIATVSGTSGAYNE